MKAKVIDPDEIVIDAKSGVTGAGRGAREDMQFAEVSEGFHAYGVGHHRHMAELDQEFSLAAGRLVTVTFTPHLVPMNRGLLSTIYVRGLKASPQELHAILLKSYANEPFVHVPPFGALPSTRHVRGSNMTFIGAAADRVAGRAIIGSALDNLTKGASGQAVQNMNLMLGFPKLRASSRWRCFRKALSQFGVLTAQAMPPAEQSLVGRHQHCVVRDGGGGNETVGGVGMQTFKLGGENCDFTG